MFASGQIKLAEISLAAHLDVHPDDTEALRTLSFCHLRLNRLSAALEALIEVLKRCPTDLRAHLLMGRTCMRLFDPDSAEHHFGIILQSLPNNESALSGLVDVALARGCPKEALSLARKIRKAKPQSLLGLLAEANSLEALGRPSEVLATMTKCTKGLMSDPSARYHWGRALLKVGIVPEGWHELRQVYEAGIQPKPSLNTPWWSGSSVGHLLVIGDQGLGDTIQFARYLLQAKQRVSKLTIACDPSLTNWLSEKIKILAIPTDSIGQLEHDAHLPITVLPSVLDLDEDPYQVGALCSFETASQASNRLAPNVQKAALKVGVSLVCSRLHSTEQFPHTRRSCAIEDALDLLQIEGAEFFNIQKEPLPAAEQHFGARWHEVGEQLHDFSDTVAWVQAMDVIVCVDSALVHLAGSIGKTTKLALPFASDWRWQLHPAINPWYPSVQMYRQTSAGEWKAVFKAIARDLQGLRST